MRDFVRVNIVFFSRRSLRSLSRKITRMRITGRQRSMFDLKIQWRLLDSLKREAQESPAAEMQRRSACVYFFLSDGVKVNRSCAFCLKFQGCIKSGLIGKFKKTRSLGLEIHVSSCWLAAHNSHFARVFFSKSTKRAKNTI